MALKLIVLFILIANSCYSQGKKNIVWVDTLTLKLENFKTKKISNSSILAGTSSTFRLNEEKKKEAFYLNVIAVSYPKKNYFTKSYIKSKKRTDSTDKEILRHENYHFNITEMFSRYIERDFYVFMQKKPRKEKRVHSKLSKLYWSYLRKWDNYEYDFDLYTDHGENIEEHEIWIAKINSELESLKQFENATIKLVKGKKKYSLVGLEKNMESSSALKK